MYFIEKLTEEKTKTYKPIKTLATKEEVAKYLIDNNLKATALPYLNSYIPLTDETIITQECMGIACSPRSLAMMIMNEKLLAK